MFKNTEYRGRSYECTNIVAVEADQAPDENWERVGPEYGLALKAQLTQLWTDSRGTFYGHM